MSYWPKFEFQNNSITPFFKHFVAIHFALAELLLSEPLLLFFKATDWIPIWFFMFDQHFSKLAAIYFALAAALHCQSFSVLFQFNSLSWSTFYQIFPNSFCSGSPSSRSIVLGTVPIWFFKLMIIFPNWLHLFYSGSPSSRSIVLNHVPISFFKLINILPNCSKFILLWQPLFWVYHFQSCWKQWTGFQELGPRVVLPSLLKCLGGAWT